MKKHVFWVSLVLFLLPGGTIWMPLFIAWSIQKEKQSLSDNKE